MQTMYTLSNEGLAETANIGKDLTLSLLVDEGIISKEQATQVAENAMIITYKNSLWQKLTKFRGKNYVEDEGTMYRVAVLGGVKLKLEDEEVSEDADTVLNEVDGED